jgi:ArsR family transcriptional regulator, arsenate/arsenite/antimonite-responsive transcriptional repressor
MKDEALEPLGRIARALGDETRLRILALLASGEICVCHIHGAIGVPQPTASRHLAYLRGAGLVATRRAGLWVHYRLELPEDPALAAVVRAAIGALTDSPGTSADRKRLSRLTNVPVRVLEQEAACCGKPRAARD